MIIRIIVLGFMLVTTSVSWAANKVITLKDGSTIKGEVISLIDGRYTIRTESLGEMIVGEDDILGITAFDPATSAVPLKQSVQNVQGQIMGDEKIMGSINALAQDQEIMKIMQDEQFVNTIMSFDEEKIRNSPYVQQLLQREDIQQIMGEIQQKIGEQ